MQAKYVKFCGRACNHHLKADPEAMIDVLMWEYIPHSTRLSELVPMPVNIAKRALSRLSELHSVNIMHGNVSLSNALLLVDHDSSNVLWIDFPCSWTEASTVQCNREYGQAAELFAAVVSP